MRVHHANVGETLCDACVRGFWGYHPDGMGGNGCQALVSDGRDEAEEVSECAYYWREETSSGVHSIRESCNVSSALAATIALESGLGDVTSIDAFWTAAR